MSAEDLAIDVGLAHNTDEYTAFVECVRNILEHGCTYSRAATRRIVQKCQRSRLDIAERVIRKCRQGGQRQGGQRQQAKWWQLYTPRREPSARPAKRRMDLTFRHKDTPSEAKRRPSRYNARSGARKRPRSPPRRWSPRRDTDRRSRKRPMSPLFQRTAIPTWPSDDQVEPRRRKRKRRQSDYTQ